MTESPVTNIAPQPGLDHEFDKVWEDVWSSIEAAGNPEGIDREEARQTLAQRLTQHAGKVFTPGDPAPGPALAV